MQQHIPEQIYLVGFRGIELCTLIGILQCEKARLHERRTNSHDLQLQVDLAEDIEEVQSHIDVLESIRGGKVVL